MTHDFSPLIEASGDLTAAARTRAPRRWTGLAGLVLLGAIAAAGLSRIAMTNQPSSLGAAAPPPPEVTVSTPLRLKTANWTSFTGQFSAVDRVELRAQVSGYLTEIHFTDGQIVKKGDLLFVIDPRPYVIALEQAQAGVQTSEAALQLANQQMARTTELKRSEFATGEALDQRVQQQHSALAALEQAKASVRSAELNLEFSHVVAPLSGRISAHRVSAGNLISGGQAGATPTLLTTIVSLDPIHLDFDMSEADYLAYQRYAATRPGPQPVDASLGDEESFAHHGTLDFIDNELDRGSGTIHARATFPNKDFQMTPGEFARVRMPMPAETSALMVPDSAISSDQSRKVVMTVTPGGTVKSNLVETGALDGSLRVIKNGIGPEDRVIINGLMRARPGTKVTAKPGTIAPSPVEG